MLEPTPEPELETVGDRLEVGASARIVGTGVAGLNVRAGPDPCARPLAILREGAQVRLAEGPRRDDRAGQWWRVVVDGEASVSGWSNASFLEPVAAGEAVERGAPPVLARALAVKLTGYTYQERGDGADGVITRSGRPAARGMVAVDPAVIPLGSQLLIEGFPDPFTATDTGFGVSGHHVDIFTPSTEEAVAFGVQYRDVFVFN